MIAVLTDLWPSRSEPVAGGFVFEQAIAVGRRYRQVVLVPRLLLPSVHHRVWGGAVQGWQAGYREPPPPHRLLRYPMLRIPRGSEAGVRAVGARLTLLAAGERPALVHGHFLYAVAPSAVRLARSLGVPCVVTAHGTDVSWLDGGIQPRLRAEMIRACLDADRVLVVAAAMADLLTAVGVSAERISIVPMGVDAERFAPRPREDARRVVEAPEGPLLLFVGRATEAKGIHVLGDALRLLGDGAPTCVALGPPGPPVRGIEQHGVVSSDTVAAWLSAADVLCLPSFGEGTPLSISEALTSGTPVVATAVGGIPEQIEEGVNGILVAPGDARALAVGISEALTIPWSRDRIRESSRGLWLDRSAGRVIEIYDELLREGPRA